MLKPETVQTHFLHQDESLDHTFSILCWNVQKNTQAEAFSIYLHELEQRNDIDILMLQEAKTDLHYKLNLKGYSYILAPNIQTKKALFGVLTATKSHYHHHQSYISHVQELMFTTHKSILYTYHLLPNEEVLLAVNIHAINFVPSFYFERDLDRLFITANEHNGPLIIAGDFNSWNKRRMHYLRNLAKRLDLNFVDFDDTHHIKSLIHYKLDHILYRGLEATRAKAFDSGKLSDHNPLHVQFELKAYSI